jgi:hypothetical protein
VLARGNLGLFTRPILVADFELNQCICVYENKNIMLISEPADLTQNQTYVFIDLTPREIGLRCYK